MSLKDGRSCTMYRHWTISEGKMFFFFMSSSSEKKMIIINVMSQICKEQL